VGRMTLIEGSERRRGWRDEDRTRILAAIAELGAWPPVWRAARTFARASSTVSVALIPHSNFLRDLRGFGL
jgi:hypothetical protein